MPPKAEGLTRTREGRWKGEDMGVGDVLGRRVWRELACTGPHSPCEGVRNNPARALAQRSSHPAPQPTKHEGRASEAENE